MTGYFNVSAPRAPGYYSFYTASLRYLEHDIHRDVTFAVVTNADAARRLAIPPLSEPDRPFDIRLHLYNETLVLFLFRNYYFKITDDGPIFGRSRNSFGRPKKKGL